MGRLTRDAQISVLKKMEASDHPDALFEQFTVNQGGYLETTTPKWTDEERLVINALIERGLLSREEVVDAPWLDGAPFDPVKESYIKLTAAGHDELERDRNNIWWKRVLRWLGRTLDKALSSIILPIVVIILGAILLKFLNL